MLRSALLALVMLCPAVAQAEDDIMKIAALSAVTLDWRHGTDDSGDRFARGGALSLFIGERDEKLPAGFELSALMARGEDGRRLYDLGASVVAAMPIEASPVAPFVAVGFDVAAVRLGQRPSDRHVTFGVHGNAGLMAVSGALFVRAQVGFLGAPGAVKTELTLGWVIE